MKQRECARYFTNIDYAMLNYLTIYKADTSYQLITVHLVIKDLIKQTHCVRYYPNIDSNMLHYWTNNKIRHYVLAN